MNQEAIFNPVPLGRDARSFTEEESKRLEALREKLIQESGDGKIISGIFKLLERQGSIQ